MSLLDTILSRVFGKKNIDTVLAAGVADDGSGPTPEAGNPSPFRCDPTTGALLTKGVAGGSGGSVSQGAGSTSDPWYVRGVEGGLAERLAAYAQLPAALGAQAAAASLSIVQAAASTFAVTQSGAWTVAQGAAAAIGAPWPTILSDGAAAVGTSGNPLRTNPTGTTAQPVNDNSGSITVDPVMGTAFSVVRSTISTSATLLPNTVYTRPFKIKNLSPDTSIYVGPDNTLTPSNGWEIGPGQSEPFNLTNSNQLYIIAASGTQPYQIGAVQ